MISHLTFDGCNLLVHLSEISLKTTKAFTHGSLQIDRNGVTFAKLPPLSLPEGFTPSDRMSVTMQLIGPDGTPRKQRRTVVLMEIPQAPGSYRAPGLSRTPRKFRPEDGWQVEIYKYRAYFNHPGINTDAAIPSWLKASIERQRAFWNRLAYLCREARRKCSPAPAKEIKEFVRDTILPCIDIMNESLGLSKQKMKHPDKLKVEEPGIDGLWRFVGELQKRIRRDHPVPTGLLDQVIAFAERYKPDYAPLNEFLQNFNLIAAQEAKSLALRHWEARPIVSAFRAALDGRKTRKAGFSEGWPKIKYPDSPKAQDWGLHYYFNEAGISSSALDAGLGVPGLAFGPPLSPQETGHPLRVGIRTKSKLREAVISVPCSKDERWVYRFAVLQHRPLPEGSHLKEWKLIYLNGALWLFLVVELQRSVATPRELVAGLDIGWRRTEDGIRFGTLYEPVRKTFRELTMNLLKSSDHVDRVPFRIDLGPTRWERRNVMRLLPDWKPGDPLPSSFETRSALQSRRDREKESVKASLRTHLGERLPAWFQKAGRKGLAKLAESFKDDPVVVGILASWLREEEELSRLIAQYFARTTKRIEYGHMHIAHDVCRHLQQVGVYRLVVESNFLAKASQSLDNNEAASLKRSQKYRQFVSVGKFVSILRNVAAKYGMAVDEVSSINTTRICHYCDALNLATEKESYVCKGCERQINLDQNAAVNLSRFGSSPDLAEMALKVGFSSQRPANPKRRDQVRGLSHS